MVYFGNVTIRLFMKKYQSNIQKRQKIQKVQSQFPEGRRFKSYSRNQKLLKPHCLKACEVFMFLYKSSKFDFGSHFGVNG